jgi:hypothetical protein
VLFFTTPVRCGVQMGIVQDFNANRAKITSEEPALKFSQPWPRIRANASSPRSQTLGYSPCRISQFEVYPVRLVNEDWSEQPCAVLLVRRSQPLWSPSCFSLGMPI